MIIKHSSPKVIGIILCRMDSTRLPGKALLEVGNIPVLGYIIKRASSINNLDEIIIATSDRQIDDPICSYACKEGHGCFRGELNDVSKRVLSCAKEFNADYFIRFNGDSPYLDVNLLQRGIEYCKEQKYDLITNLIGRTFPYGISLEIIKTQAFEYAYSNMKTAEEKEHVTKYFYENISNYAVKSMINSSTNSCNAKLVIDTSEDFERFKHIVNVLGERIYSAGYEEILNLYNMYFS